MRMTYGAFMSMSFFKTGVARDDPAIEIVEVARGETAAIELEHRTEIRGDHRDDVENHPFRLLLRIAESLDDFESLREL
jgi:hypothetical protein